MNHYSFQCEGEFYGNASPGTILKILFGKSVRSSSDGVFEQDVLRRAARDCSFRLRHGCEISKDSLYYFLASNFICNVSIFGEFEGLKKKYGIPDNLYELCSSSECRARYEEYGKVFEEVLKDLKLTRV